MKKLLEAIRIAGSLLIMIPVVVLLVCFVGCGILGIDDWRHIAWGQWIVVIIIVLVIRSVVRDNKRR